MEFKLRISGIVEESIVDGPGLRFVVFTQGCPHHCKGCHNPQTHDFNGGEERDVRAIFEMFMENPLLSGITFSGGEPFVQPQPLCILARLVKGAGKNIVVYSGYTFEQLKAMGEKNPAVLELLGLCDTLIDGPFIEEQKDLDLLFRGSQNQRIIDLTSPENAV
ncbi:MAG: anaerobic ribonucleoside-triphosphate reductase activating protein [Catenibacillus sp.]